MNHVKQFHNRPKEGMRAWISQLQPYPLPEGLGNRREVRILAAGPTYCAVQTRDYRHWVVETIHLDCGHRYDVTGNGSRTPEDHPAALAHLEHCLKELRAQRLEQSIEHIRLAQISKIVWILTRTGWPPPPAEDPEQHKAEVCYDLDVIAAASEDVPLPFQPGEVYNEDRDLPL